LGDRVGIEPGSHVSEEHPFRILGIVEDPSQESSSAVPARADGGDGEVLRIKSEERAVEAKIAHAVAGFDLTFSDPKSVSAL